MLSNTYGITDLVNCSLPLPTSLSFLCCGCGNYIGMKDWKTLITDNSFDYKENNKSLKLTGV